MPMPENQGNTVDINENDGTSFKMEDLSGLDIFQELGFEAEAEKTAPEKELSEAELVQAYSGALDGLCRIFEQIFKKHALDGDVLSTKESALLGKRTEAFLAAQDKLEKQMDGKEEIGDIRAQDLIRAQVMQDAGLLNPEEDRKFRITVMSISGSDQQPEFMEKLTKFHDSLMQKMGGFFAESPAMSGILNGLDKAVHATHKLMCGISPQPMLLMPGLLATARQPEMMNGIAGFAAMNRPLVMLRFHQLPMNVKQKLEREGIAKASGLKKNEVPTEIVEIHLRKDGDKIKGWYRHKRKPQNQPAMQQQTVQAEPAKSTVRERKSGKAL